MLAKIPHVNVDLCLVSTHVVVNLAQEKLKRPHEVSILLPDEILLGLEFLLNVVNKLFEVTLII